MQILQFHVRVKPLFGIDVALAEAQVSNLVA